MPLNGTYSGLLASIADFLLRSDAGTVAAIPDFVVLAEAQMHRRLIGRQRQGFPIPRRLILRSDASFATNDEYVAVPTDIAGPINLQLTASDGTILDLDYLEPVNLQAMKAAAFANGSTSSIPFPGWPVYYTVIGSELQIFPVADKAYTAELTYIKRLAAASGATNFILTDYPDAYLYGALVAAVEYLKISDTRKDGWQAKFVAAIDDICNSDPMPSDKSMLRTEIAVIQRYSRSGGYNINTDR